MRSWTNEQIAAIEKSGTNIIVSAGAGSGKTAVLTERVIRKLKRGISIDKLLVLTFTKAAAHEMKERIREELKNDETLSSELALLDSAYITTFDSYALSIVKKYGYLANISPNVSIIDSSILKMKKESIIDEIFENLYKEKNTNFLKLISDFCVKDDKNIKDYIIKMNDKLDMKYAKDEYLTSYVNNHFDESKIINDIKLFEHLLHDKIKTIKTLLSKIGDYVDSSYYEILETDLQTLISSKTYNDIKSNLDVTLTTMPRGTDERAKEYRKEIVNIIDELKKICFWDNDDEIKESINSTKSYAEIIIDIIKLLDKTIKEYKFENDLYEFSDIANLSIKLLKENEIVKEELKKYFHEILVDEYQDTNDLQEEFISLISNNNVYMVGDIKQSIYRFRNANPQIFKDKYNLYKENDGGIKIDLNKNFRSRNEVLSNINLIFDDIMDDSFGGANYRLEHRLEFGNVLYEDEGKTSQNQDLELYNYEFDRDSNFKKEEIEAFIIANDIKNKINNKYQVFDMKNKSLRDIKYSDFCILMDRATQFDLYKKIFTYLNIPLMVFKDDNIASSNDILSIKSLLKLILCLKNKDEGQAFKYAFMSVGRSFICDYNDNELFLSLTNNTYRNTFLYEKANDISKMADALSIDKLLQILIDEFHIYESIIKIGNVKEMIYRLDYLIENASSLSKIGYNLEMFIDYLEENLNAESDIKIPGIKEESDACSIMTIHKSKGLEFNICYYSGLYSSFNIGDLKELFYYDNTYGIITPYFKDGICQTIYKYLLKEKYIKEEIEEKLRLFYVALTRSKEKMILVSTFNDESSYDREDGLISLPDRLKYRSILDIILSVKDNLNSFIKNINIDTIIDRNYISNRVLNYSNLIKESEILIEKHELNISNREIDNSSYSKKIHDLLNNDDIKNMEFGKTMHYYLEMIDFNNPVFDNIESLYQQKINKFLSSDILNDVSKSKIYKEYEFIYSDELGKHHGIIDLMLEYSDCIKIIDYKLKNIDEEAYNKQLLGYKKYIESISNKRVELYLYSIMEETFKHIS